MSNYPKPIVLCVFGTRPEAIKMLPVVKAMRASMLLDCRVAVTGQHRLMLDQVFAAFDETPDIDLDLMTPRQTLSDITARVVMAVSRVYEEIRPAIVLVHGDTTTAMAASMAAFYGRVPLGHVEAGLRSFDLQNPWPEEFNRVMVDLVAKYVFAPTEKAACNLRREFPQLERRVYVTGNTGIDAALYMAERLTSDEALERKISLRYKFLDPSKRLILVTGHRRESFGSGFQRICEGLLSISLRDDCEIIYPVHLNPEVRCIVLEYLANKPNIHLIDPVEYRDMVYLMARSSLILTDSGGIQEEGPALGKPVLVMRNVTERPEAVDAGVAKLVGTDPVVMRREVDTLLDSEEAYVERARRIFPYGDGSAARKIVEHLTNELVAGRTSHDKSD